MSPGAVLGIILRTMCFPSRILPFLAVTLVLAGEGCVSTPRVGGVAGTPKSANVPWTAPEKAVKAEPSVTKAPTLPISPDLIARIQQLTLVDVVDLALQNNPATRASWSQARASADVLGSARGRYFPTIDAS